MPWKESKILLKTVAGKSVFFLPESFCRRIPHPMTAEWHWNVPKLAFQ